MPRLNLKDDELGAESDPLDSERNVAPPPTLREVGGGEHHSSPLLMIVVIVVVVGAGIFALNYFHVIHLWGKRAPKVAEVLPEPAQFPPADNPAVEEPAASTPTPDVSTTPMPEPNLGPSAAASKRATAPPAKTPNVSVPASSASGTYTVQVSSWADRSTADDQAALLTRAGFNAFVEEGNVSGQTWYRVRVGRYDTEQEAQQAAVQVQQSAEELVWVARVGR